MSKKKPDDTPVGPPKEGRQAAQPSAAAEGSPPSTPAKKPGPGVAPRSAAAPISRSAKHVDRLLELSPSEREQVLGQMDPPELRAVFDASFAADLVNVLLDLRKVAVKSLFESLARTRKRGLTEVVALYFYREYLTNPLPLQVTTDKGDRMPNYYAILGMSRDASDDALKEAYRFLDKAHHEQVFSPALRDAGGQRREEIKDAYQHLKAVRRSQTDRLLPGANYLYPRREQSWLEAAQRVLG